MSWYILSGCPGPGGGLVYGFASLLYTATSPCPSQACLQIQMVGGSPAPMNRLWLQFTQTIGSFLHRVNGSSLRLCNCGVVTHVP